MSSSAPIESTPGGDAAPAPLPWSLSVLQFLQVSDDYALVKVARSSAGPSEGLQGHPVPTVPVAEILRTLASLAAVVAASAEQAAQQTTEDGAGGRAVPPQNGVFLATRAERSPADRVADLETGRLLQAVEMRQRLGMSRQALAAAVRKRRLFTVDGPQGEKLYPAFFADPLYVGAELAAVSSALGDVSGEVKWQFFTSPLASLDGRTPLAALAEGGSLSFVYMGASAFVAR